MTQRSITVTDTTLFQVAALWLGDATQWDRIASLNLLDDPVVVGTVTLTLPPVSSTTGSVGGVRT